MPSTVKEMYGSFIQADPVLQCEPDVGSAIVRENSIFIIGSFAISRSHFAQDAISCLCIQYQFWHQVYISVSAELVASPINVWTAKLIGTNAVACVTLARQLIGTGSVA